MIAHPDEGVFFTDYFGRPIDVGDVIVYPTARGSSSAELSEALIEEVVPLVEKPGEWHSTGRRSRVPTVRADQLNRSYPTEYPVHKSWTEAGPDWSKAYILIVRVANSWNKADDGYSERKSVVKNVCNVIVKPQFRPVPLPDALKPEPVADEHEVMAP